MRLDVVYTIGHTLAMKTAISIDDAIFEQAELTAQELGLTRSRLYTQAVAEFIQVHRPDSITAKLNEIYSKEENRVVDPIIAEASLELLRRVEWE